MIALGSDENAMCKTWFLETVDQFGKQGGGEGIGIDKPARLTIVPD